MAISNSGSVALTTKLKAMHGKRLRSAQYKELLRRQSVAEIAAYLKQQPVYAQTLKDINENSVHRGQLENVIRQQLYTDYMKMLTYISEDELDFYDFFLKRMEIDGILGCLRSLLIGGSGNNYLWKPDYFAKHASFDINDLANVGSFDELREILAKTPYSALLGQFDPTSANKTDSIMIENRFYSYYYSEIFGIISSAFSGEVKDDISGSFGVEVDMTNITEIIRLKKYYDVKSSMIRPLQLPYYHLITKAEVARMVDAPDATAAMQTLMQTAYGRYFGKNGQDYIEGAAQQIEYGYNKKLLAFTLDAPVAVTAYLQLKKLEIKNVVSIIEGVRYGLPPAEISKIIVDTGD
jgi:V/A-type H+-transporting ATPase subunit C